MMIHEKLMSGQFLLDLKNDRTGLLQAAAVAHHHQQQPMHLQPPSPPMPALDLYSAYAYQQQLQQQLLNSAVPLHQSNVHTRPQGTEVLDLSRRCDSVETPRKTPSPYQTNSSLGTGSPTGSPSAFFVAQQSSTSTTTGASLLPANILYAAQSQKPTQNALPAGLASLYPGLYYTNTVKQEPMATSSPPPAAVSSQTEAPNGSGKSLLQTFAAAAAVSMKQDLPEPHSPQQQQQSNAATTPTSSTNGPSSLDAKSTRPFKAFPRDPLVIAANFAATDVLLDNPRVERYTEYRKRVLEQIRSSNGGSRTITNPKMRRTNSRSGSIYDGSSNNNSESEERQHCEESSDCDSNSGNDSQNSANSTNNNATNAVGNTSNTPNSTNTSCNGIIKDAAYYERRRKNNAAAKKSRDRRRIKEDEIAIRAAYLERQNIELLCQIDALKAQLAALTSKM
ncbi:protein giant [Stomoxys calcitrans]|uniref:protein giant n=1 Tax=Stomoxys calcitrans TaxID=35570 RepID=UPI0027E2C164|nr:protein giant [Stomoxys calcitrans]XP_013103233.2 protein giant [Stomoxys calcitrans]XP_013103234.2 protein giant [Stomoxys calcitrans]XP_013103235.2 protein giant [Stomoxys calcitrans]XP_013103236.2 protein giant [Stomoxys calcitrans]XP_059222592.1 protein giant [Stomoxys calcitrans]XP_059222593.1 protein giant [Stomoxys calcitrans]XP_059222595.1 protein giant [Stomoxys calcitrans]XP_059222596.1 protein giant [Stomoxys calcitrans]